MSGIINRKYFHVYTRPTWSAGWTRQIYLTAESVVRGCAPQVDRAVLRLHWGTGIWENGASMVDAAAMPDLSNYYVMILSSDIDGPGGDEQKIFVGVIAKMDYQILGESYTGARSADQLIQAFGLEILLEQRIQNSIVLRSGTLYTTKKVQPFNRRASGGEIQGNRSSIQYATLIPDGIHDTFVYDVNATDIDTTDVWTYGNVIEYVLAYNQPSIDTGNGPIFGYAPDPNIGAYLDDLIDVLDVSQLTTRQVLNALCNRARGLTWFIDYDENLETLFVVITSMLDADLVVDDITIPENPYALASNIWSIGETTRVKIMQDDSQRFDRIVVAGSNIKVCGTWSYSAGELETGWTAAAESAYKDPSKNVADYGALSETDQAVLNDTFRGTDRFDNVYTLFRVPGSWNWYLGGSNAAPKWNPVFRTLGPTALAEYWNGNKRFLALIPFKVGKDYAVATPTSENVAGSDAEFRRPFAIAQNTDDEWMFLDKKPAPHAGVRILQTEMGVQVKFKPAYLFSGISDSGFEPGGWTPDLAEYGVDYSTLKVTAMVETDETFEVWRDLTTSEFRRTKIITVPDAELWYIVPGTVVDVDDAGALKTYAGTSNEIRNDVDKLTAIAAAAESWYGKTRYKITVKDETLIEPSGGYLGRLLQYENPIDQGGEPIGATITSIAYSLTGPKPYMVILTDNAELDLALIFGSSTQNIPAMIPSLNVAEKEIAGVKRKVAELQTEINKNPLRIETGGGGNRTKIRKAYVDGADAMTDTTVDCFLDVDTTGEKVSVNCVICGGSALNTAYPRLADGTLFHVYNDAGTWRSLVLFQASETC